MIAKLLKTKSNVLSPKASCSAIHAQDRGIGEPAPANLTDGLARHALGEIDADKRSSGTYSLGCREKHRAPTGPNVQDASTWTDVGKLDKPLGRLLEKARTNLIVDRRRPVVEARDRLLEAQIVGHVLLTYVPEHRASLDRAQPHPIDEVRLKQHVEDQHGQDGQD
jgi:hypothetical protein